MTREKIKKHLMSGGTIYIGHETYTEFLYSCPHDGYEDGFKWEYENVSETLDDLEFACNGDWSKLEMSL